MGIGFPTFNEIRELKACYSRKICSFPQAFHASNVSFVMEGFNMAFFPQEDACDLDAYTLAKSYFDLKEYDRAAYFLRNCKSPKAYFLYMYSRYLVS